MSERFDYQRQEQDERRQYEERIAEAVAMSAALEAHRRWKTEFNKENTHAES